MVEKVKQKFLFENFKCLFKKEKQNFAKSLFLRGVSLSPL